LSGCVSQRFERSGQPKVFRHAWIQRPRNISDLIECGPEQIASISQVRGTCTSPDVVDCGGNLEACCGESLRYGILEIARDLGALISLLVYDIGAELSHALAARGESVEHVIHGIGEMRESRVGYERWWNSFTEPSLRYAASDVLEVIDWFECHANQCVAHAGANS
jgi:hypothetical protein